VPKLTHSTLLLLLLLVFPFSGEAQQLSNIKSKRIEVKADTTQLDTLSIVPGSEMLILNGDLVKAEHFQIDYSKALLIWKTTLPTSPVLINYRVFPFNLAETHSHKDLSKINAGAEGVTNPFKYTAEDGTGDLFNTGSLNKSGSISRGVSFGNNQDLSVNSNLNLQLSGKLNDKMSILASVTDDNIPIQPDGNTQQLQDFDQVFIQIFDDKSKLTAGDFWLKKPTGYFMTYNKRAQGGSFSTKFYPVKPLDEKNVDRTKYGLMKMQASAAVSKGKFARNVVQGVEGNQGPYKLIGSENESFIIVLSGTERVFIDGELLNRGQENDYVIDYNTAEVTFTPNRLITKDRRIVIEFQYSDKNYARSLLQYSTSYEFKKLNLYFNVFSEQDSKNQPLQQELSEAQRNILGTIGDSLNEAISSSIDSVGFTNSLVLYKMVDTLGYDSVFVYSNAEDSAFYQLGFSNVGLGNGDYDQEDFTALGRTFKWVAPDTINNVIVRNGTYAPVVLLISPKKRQMVTLGGTYKFSKQTQAGFEVALSNYDLNTFSTVNNNDNTGYAAKATFKTAKPLQKNKNPWTFISDLNFETVDKNFTRIERFRAVEFERNWNVLNKTLEETQYIADVEVGLKQGRQGQFTYGFNTFQATNEYSGLRNKLGARLNKNGYKLDFNGSLLSSESDDKTSFMRHKSLVSKNIKFLKIGFKDEHEKNEFYDVNTDTLLLNSYQFYDWEVFISNSDSSKNKFSVFYRQRTDKLARTNKLNNAHLAEQYGFTFDLIKNPKNQLRGKMGYRKLTIADTTLTNTAPDNTLLSRLEYSFKLFNGAISSATFYEIGSGQELKREFVYIEVNDGQGVYTWNDYNEDGIKDLNEFEIAAFTDQADYIRVFTPTNIYVKTFTNQFNQVLNLKPSMVWRKRNSKDTLSNMKQFIAKFSNQTAYRIDRKTNNESAETTYNPFLKEIADTTLLTLNSSLRNTVYFNRTTSKFGLDHTYQDVRSKSLLTNGFDTRTNTFHEGRIRWNITRKLDFLLKGESGEKTSSADYVSGRDYAITYYNVKPKLSYLPSTKFRASISAEYEEKQNAEELGNQQATILDIGTEVRYNVVGKGSLLANFNYINIEYTGVDNTSLAFEMLEALKTGLNLTWSLSYQRQLSKNMQLSLIYNGRNSEEVKAIHSGGVQVRASF
jgi:hypothetical protein